jgi:hypothetical protein
MKGNIQLNLYVLIYILKYIFRTHTNIYISIYNIPTSPKIPKSIENNNPNKFSGTSTKEGAVHRSSLEFSCIYVLIYVFCFIYYIETTKTTFKLFKTNKSTNLKIYTQSNQLFTMFITKNNNFLARGRLKLLSSAQIASEVMQFEHNLIIRIHQSNLINSLKASQPDKTEK